MRRMLDPKEAGGSLPSTITFDGEGNRKVGKDLGIDGKLKLKSLVSESNPDGDITKELGGGGGGGNTLYEYRIAFQDTTQLGVSRKAKFYSSVDIGRIDKDRTSTELYNQLLPGGSGYVANLDAYGCVKITTDSNDTYYPIVEITINSSETSIYYLDPSKGKTKYTNKFLNNSTKWLVIRNIASPRQAN